MSEDKLIEKKERKIVSGVGFEVHFDGEAKSFVLYASNSKELEEVRQIAERFQGVGLKEARQVVEK